MSPKIISRKSHCENQKEMSAKVATEPQKQQLDDVDSDLCGDEPQIRLPMRKRERDNDPKANCKPDGTPIHPEDSRYIGTVDLDGYYTGFGEMIYPNGVVYAGDFLHGYYHGTGTLKSIKGHEYCGQLLNGYAHGKGVVTKLNGTKHDGTFLCDKAHGKMTITHLNGTILELEYVAGTVVGDCQITYVCGSKFRGPWPFNLNVPYTGSYVDPEGHLYQGELMDRKRNGRGTLSISGGHTITGTFRDDKIVLPEGSPIKKLQLGK
jgi:hypothetical protein